MKEEKVNPEAPAGPGDLSTLVVSLLKGVIYRETDENMWGTLINLQARVRDYVSVLALDLVLDEAEGYAFLKGRPESEDDESAQKRPRLVTRRQLSFPVSLLLALLRKKLAEFDAGGGHDGEGSRLVLTRDDIVDLLRLFLPESSNEAKLVDQIETHINKIEDMGFLRRLKPPAGATTGPGRYEVRRILKAFVDAQWLADFDKWMKVYQGHAAGVDGHEGAVDG